MGECLPLPGEKLVCFPSLVLCRVWSPLLALSTHFPTLAKSFLLSSPSKSLRTQLHSHSLKAPSLPNLLLCSHPWGLWSALHHSAQIRSLLASLLWFYICTFSPEGEDHIFHCFRTQGSERNYTEPPKRANRVHGKALSRNRVLHTRSRSP